MVILKIRYGSECRRVKLETLMHLDDLNQMISNMFGIKGEFTIKYDDPQNDEVLIKDQSDLARAYGKLNARGALYLIVSQGAAEEKPHRHHGRGGRRHCRNVPTESAETPDASDCCDSIKDALIRALGAGHQPLVTAMVEGIAALAKEVLAKVLPVVGPLVAQWIDHPMVQLALSFLKVNPDSIRAFFRTQEEAAPAAKPAEPQPTSSTPLRFHRGPSCRRFLSPGVFQINQPEQVRHNAVCDRCNVVIVGIRYKCSDCPDYDLCMGCIDQKGSVHDAAHTFTKITSPYEHLPVRHNAVCDNCQSRIVGTRHKCQDCNDYDLCMACIGFRSSVHYPDHQFKEHPHNIHHSPVTRVFSCTRNVVPENNNVEVVIQSKEPLFVEPEVVDLKVVEPKVVEPKVVEPKVVEPKVVEPKVVEPKVETKVIEQEEPFKYEKELKLLVGMGFEDTLRARFALLKYHGNLAATVDLLVSGQ